MIDLYLRHEYLVASVQLTLAMLGMGATITLKDFVQIFRHPGGLVLGNATQLLLVPVIAWLFMLNFNLGAGIAIGIALCAAIPGGTTSNIFTFLARGNAPLSVTMTSTTTLACLITTPLILTILAAEHMPASFAMPTARIALDVILFLLLPLGLGMVYARFYPASADRFSKICIRASIATIAVIVIGSMGAGRLDLNAYGFTNAAMLLLFLAIVTVLSIVVPKLFRLGAADVTAINMEISIRNVNLGLLVKTSMFPTVIGSINPIGNDVLMTVLLYGGYQLALCVPLIYLGRMRHSRALARANGVT
jgi:BASS family bile acid:Na+ symporter